MQNTDLCVRTKSNEIDPVTRADDHSERRIAGAIRSDWPDDGIHGEEGTRESDGAEYRWVIDPIDGTVNYANRLPYWSISVALFQQETRVAGIVAAPGQGWVYRAVLGCGATKNGVRIQVGKQKSLREGLVITGFPYQRLKSGAELGAAVHVLLDHAADVRRFGSAALDLCLVADGRAVGFIEVGLNAWDVAAGGLILEEAGGRLSDLEGADHDPFASSGIIATNGITHSALVALAQPFRDAAGLRG